MAIPIQNIYFLLCYAWDKLDEDDSVIQAKGLDFNSYVDLFAMVLNNGCHHLFKRGIDKDYLLQEELLKGIRGKINFAASAKKNTFQYGQAICEYDEFSIDVLHNQILKGTIKQLLEFENLDKAIRKNLRETYSRFHFVSDKQVTGADFGRVRLHRNNQFYDFLLKVCKIVHDNVFIEKGSGHYVFRDFVEDKNQMALLFQNFVRNFYKRSQDHYKVSGEQIPWAVTDASMEAFSLLPYMNTDISLTSSTHKIIIDTKYYQEALKTRFDKQQVIAGNLYQIYSYVRNAQDNSTDNLTFEGMLLYPVVSKELDHGYVFEDYKISVKTINLNQSCEGIKKDLLAMISL